MATVQEIITNVQTALPMASLLTNAQILKHANDILLKCWKYMSKPDIYSFSLIANQPTYTLPTDGQSLDKISVVEIASDSSLDTWTPYYFKGLLDETEISSYFYDGYNGIIGIYPTPTVSITNGARIFYGTKFTLLSASDLTATPEVNEDYHTLIENYVCMKVALSGNNPDTARHNDFANAFNDDWSRMISDWTRTKVKTPIKHRCNSQWL